MNNELWEKIVVVHNSSKALFLWCEENNIELKSFLQPNNELKNAWEHVVRAKANELAVVGKPDPIYIENNLVSALGHEYRAFFDICDWLSIILRERLSRLLEPYDNKTISNVIPIYYTQIRPQFERLNTDIAKLRGNKNIAQKDDIINHVTEYNAIMEKLIDWITSISESVPALEDYKKREEAADTRAKIWDLLKLVLAAVVGVGLALIIQRLWK
jgi:hypothetical protein